MGLWGAIKKSINSRHTVPLDLNIGQREDVPAAEINNETSLMAYSKKNMDMLNKTLKIKSIRDVMTVPFPMSGMGLSPNIFPTPTGPYTIDLIGAIPNQMTFTLPLNPVVSEAGYFGGDGEWYPVEGHSMASLQTANVSGSTGAYWLPNILVRITEYE